MGYAQAGIVLLFTNQRDRLTSAFGPLYYLYMGIVAAPRVPFPNSSSINTNTTTWY